ncbi:hypothetical protein [Mycobacterium sp.]|uniref:hypothetical protein n=1 Tax=Mycobacterium sp. TaxID=1785 RepID=UPI0031E13BB1
MAAGAGVTVAMIGMAGAPAARADDGALATDIGLLDTAAADTTEAFTMLTNQPGVVIGIGNPDLLTGAINQFEAIQTPLLSSDNSFLSGLGDSLFNGPDQQLAQTSDVLVTAVQSYIADPSSTTDADVLSATFQYDDSVAFDSLPANVIGEVIDQVFGIGGYDTAGASATDVASPAASAYLTSLSGLHPDLGSLSVLGDNFNVVGADIGAELFSVIGAPDIFLP